MDLLADRRRCDACLNNQGHGYLFRTSVFSIIGDIREFVARRRSRMAYLFDAFHLPLALIENSESSNRIEGVTVDCAS